MRARLVGWMRVRLEASGRVALRALLATIALLLSVVGTPVGASAATQASVHQVSALSHANAYATSVHVYDSAAHSAQAHTSGAALGAAQDVAAGPEWTATTSTEDISDLSRLSVAADTASLNWRDDTGAIRLGGGANDAPSWVAREAGLPEAGESAQQYAARILDNKYGAGDWPKGGGSEFSKIVKWFTRGGRTN